MQDDYYNHNIMSQLMKFSDTLFTDLMALFSRGYL